MQKKIKQLQKLSNNCVVVKTIIKGIVELLDYACCLTHPFVEYEIRLTGTHCNLASLAFTIDELFETNLYKKVEEEDLYYD